MKVLSIIGYEDLSQGCPTAILEFSEGADEDELYCKWVRSKGRSKDRTDEEILAMSTDAWFVMDVQSLPCDDGDREGLAS